MKLDQVHQGLLWAALGEATGGFAAGKFPAVDQAAARILLNKLKAIPKIVLNREDLVLSKQALAFSLKELGPEEFFTITGYEFEVGQAVAEELGRMDAEV